MGLEPIEKLVSKTNTFTNFVTRALICFPEGLAGELLGEPSKKAGASI